MPPLPDGDLSRLSPEAVQQLIFGKPGEDAFLLKGYHIERELGRGGRGGCGAVYLAKPRQNGAEKVAVKIMLSRAGSRWIVCWDNGWQITCWPLIAGS